MDVVARDVYNLLKKDFVCFYDESGSIGRRYARQDEIGTKYCVTIDSQTMIDETVTIRDIDTTEQTRISISQLSDYIKEKNDD